MNFLLTFWQETSLPHRKQALPLLVMLLQVSQSLCETSRHAPVKHKGVAMYMNNHSTSAPNLGSQADSKTIMYAREKVSLMIRDITYDIQRTSRSPRAWVHPLQLDRRKGSSNRLPMLLTRYGALYMEGQLASCSRLPKRIYHRSRASRGAL